MTGVSSYNCTSYGTMCCLAPTPECPTACDADYGVPSVLFGCVGEQWKPDGRLPDFSYAGYGAGEGPGIPDVPVVADLKRDFGAAGDGVTDDTEAFRQALVLNSSVAHGALYLPPGTYM